MYFCVNKEHARHVNCPKVQYANFVLMLLGGDVDALEYFNEIDNSILNRNVNVNALKQYGYHKNFGKHQVFVKAYIHMTLTHI